jgi:transketolase
MTNNLFEITRQLRYNIIRSTTAAGTGHPTSSLSGVEFITAIMFDGHFRAELDKPLNINNDRLIFSKGHACPLLYALYYTAGHLSEAELMSLRKFGSNIEGHPTMNWEYTEAATGSLGQGLGVAVGMALGLKKEIKEQTPKVYCVLGDSEMAEGSIWEAMNSAVYLGLDNIVAIVDFNRLGQRGQTQIGHDTNNIKAKCEAFGWETFVIEEGNDLESCRKLMNEVSESTSGKPKIVIAKTYKGAGISFLENKDGWHGKALPQADCDKALAEIGEADLELRGEISYPKTNLNKEIGSKNSPLETAGTAGLAPATQLSEGWQSQTDGVDSSQNQTYELKTNVATRKAYGNALSNLGGVNSNIVALDGEMNNSTYSEIFAKNYPDRYYEMFIAEQNMISVASGLSRIGLVPFASTFAAFWSRAADQIRMGQYSHSNLKIMGSHCGVSIGPDGSSQMAVEDIAIFRAILDSIVLYPSDAVSTDRLMSKIAHHVGISYLRCTRAETPVIYGNDETFEIGGSKTLRSSNEDKVTVIAAGITLHEALKAYEILKEKGITIRVIDLYSIKPLDLDTLKKANAETKQILVVEDHYREGGIYEAICGSGTITKPIHSLCVTKMSCSGKPEELMRLMEIDAQAIVEKVEGLV